MEIQLFKCLVYGFGLWVYGAVVPSFVETLEQMLCAKPVCAK